MPNVAAPDVFGPGGPGTPPDGLSDDFLRVTAVGVADDTTYYAFNDPFQITQGETFSVTDLTVTQTPPPLPETIVLNVDSTLLAIGDVAAVSTTATLSDGAEIDVTPRSLWTTYRTSNPGIVTVEEREEGVRTHYRVRYALYSSLQDDFLCI